MQAPTFYVVLEGATAPQGDATAVNAQLAHLIKRTPEQAEALLLKAPVTLKRGLSAELADKYVHALKQVGVRARKVSESRKTLALEEDSFETPPIGAAG